MRLLCNDVDLLRREPGLLRECRVVASRLVSLPTTYTGVSGAVSALVFNGDTPVRPGNVAWIEQRSRAFAVIGLGEQIIQVAAVTNQMPDDPTNDVPELEAGPGDGGVTTEVWTFPQISWASRRVLARLDLRSLTTAGQFDAEALREVAALFALAAVFRSMSALDRTLVNDNFGRGVSFSQSWRLHGEWYERAADRELRRLKLAVDANLDGRAEAERAPGVPGLMRV